LFSTRSDSTRVINATIAIFENYIAIPKGGYMVTRVTKLHGVIISPFHAR